MTSLETIYSIYKKSGCLYGHPTLNAGLYFFALRGANFNGNTYVGQALAQGAAYCVIDDPAYQSGTQTLLVEDVLSTLQQLARLHRQQFLIPVIAIGGSNGKTTTKELVSAVLSSHYPCHFTKGNLNNHIGVPLTLLAMPEDTEVAVIEMGANQPGDMEELCHIALPTHGLLTNIGKEHLEGFGNLEGVKKAEGELYRYLARNKGCVFVNLNEKYLKTMTRHNPRKVPYTRSEELGVQDGIIDVVLRSELPFVEVAFLSEHDEKVQAKTHLFGRHNFQNVMTAIALGIYFKVPAVKIKTALETYEPRNNRSQLISKGGYTIILDAYNANPSSMAVTLDSLKAMQAGKKVIILGDMLEVGTESRHEHEFILRKAARMHPDQLVVIGPEFGKTPYQKHKALHFENASDARAWFKSQNFETALILIKGSRGIRLEQLLED